MKPTIRILPDADQLARFAARLFMSRLILTLPIQVQFTVALSGGSTPKKMFEILGDDKRLKNGVKLGTWDYLHFFWSDERHVPPDHAESNFKLAYDSMLAPLGIREANVHRIKGELEDAGVAAHQYEAEILRDFPVADNDDGAVVEQRGMCRFSSERARQSAPRESRARRKIRAATIAGSIDSSGVGKIDLVAGFRSRLSFADGGSGFSQP